MYFYSKLTFRVPIRISQTFASIDVADLEEMLNRLQNENASEEGQDVVEESTIFYKLQFISHALQEFNFIGSSSLCLSK